MKKIIAKSVGMFELFYDLVFVYAISKITAMVHHPVNGGIPLVTLLQFLFVVIVVLQIWLFQALYFNRYSQNRYNRTFVQHVCHGLFGQQYQYRMADYIPIL